MNLTDIFTSPFKLVASRTFVDPTPSLRVSLKTKNITTRLPKKKYLFYLKCISTTTFPNIKIIL